MTKWPPATAWLCFTNAEEQIKPPLTPRLRVQLLRGVRPDVTGRTEPLLEDRITGRRNS